ncbi:MAPEG family protein [Sphingomonas sp. GB1N7]|uniref:MAPEG family protein n=1 Tax=Parasphingomonas caseinilytica TaxID=3096158 RepID=UPI002FC705C1
MHSEILKPIVVLIAWSLVMWAWMIAVRLPAMKKVGIDLSKARGGKPGQLDGVVPDQAQWPAHNYMHLMEQPTLFYAVALVIAFTGTGNGFNATLAWAYVGLRIVHSIVQATFNKISTRFALFLLSSLVLIALTLHAAMAVF